MNMDPMEDPPVRLEAFEDRHVEGLRAACAKDQDVWEIYPYSMLGEHFDRVLPLLRTREGFRIFAALEGDQVVGMSSYIDWPEPGCIEIGGTYIEPRLRGGDYNRRMKSLMIARAHEVGFDTLIFKVDTRNGRSMRAVEKLGARRVDTLIAQMTTWTGYVRDSAVFRLEKGNWLAGG